MSMMAFHLLFPKEAKNETRAVTPVFPGKVTGHRYMLMEYFCIDPKCDCRRVMINVIDTENDVHVATINHAFEPPKPPFEDEGQTFLDLMNPQSALSDDLLDMFKKMVADDEEYRQRLERHYKMWKSVVDDPSHPDHPKVRSEFHDDPDFEPAFPRQETVRRDGPKVGPNDPCPCGSGKKFKKCCRQ